MAVKLNRHDLEFVLKQIRIAEAHVAGTPLMQLIDQPHLPFGLRTVDGTYNNLIAGREQWGASDQPMPRMFDPRWNNEGDETGIDINGPDTRGPDGIPGTPDDLPPGVDDPADNVTNTDYEAPGHVVDTDPRIITNLIADQTLKNPAAIVAALQFAEYDGPILDAPGGPGALTTINGLFQTYLGEAATAVAAALSGLGAEATTAQKKAAVAGAIEPLKSALHETLLADYGIEMDGDNLVVPNVAPDEGLSAPFNGWMTFFGQFFDHGLDLIHKGDNGTVWVPLAADDPLRTHGPDGIAGSGDEVPPSRAFMAITRLAPVKEPGPDGLMGTADDITTREARNKTTPFVDQNQTYTSHASHQVFLREYEMVDGKPMATGHLLDGVDGGLATWADVKLQALEKLGIQLSDLDVLGVPLLRTDAYGEFIRGPDGFPQVIYNIGPDLIPNTADDLAVSATPGNPIVLATINGGLGPVRTSHQFLDDISNNANPVGTVNGQPAILQPDENTETDPLGNPIPSNPDLNPAYDNELLDKHFITGDGRGNENIGLTAVHHVFHSEHNRQVDDVKKQALAIAASGEADDIAFLNEWLLQPVGPGFNPATLQWDGERLFQAARFATEMQYQHLVFEEFGRKVQPNIDLFVFNTITDVNPSIFAEFAHTVYRFGHSMLTEHLKLLPLNADGSPKLATGQTIQDWGADVGLIEAFLNPVMYDENGSLTAEQAAGAIIRGMTYVRGSAIDEFVVESLRNNLLGLPLDLAAINIARARDAGVPSLNEARAQLFAASNSTWLKPYESWADFGANLKTPASIINFIAAYGQHETIVDAVTMAEKRDAAMAIVFGVPTGTAATVPTDRLDFLNGSGSWNAESSGLNDVDLWIGGLAERLMPFGGMLGSTFNAVFELQLENLQEGDRFYYLSRTQGLNLLNELENNAFSKLIMANTDIAEPGPDGIRGTEDDIVRHHIGIDSFAKYDGILEVDLSKQIALDPEGDDPFLNAIRDKVQRDDPTTAGADQNYLRFTGGEHMVMGGTAGSDTIIGGDGDDGIWGGAGDDRIESGHGVDLVSAGAGDDIITDSGDTGDFLKGESGDDIIANSNGLDVLMGGDGKDIFLVGVDATEVFGGEGDDFMLGGLDHDFLLGNEGDDWMEGGDGFDVLNGDNSELFFNSTILGHDVMFAGENENDFDAESGDDIMVQGESVMRNEGMFGFDWAIYKGSSIAADADMRIPFFTTVADDILRDRFDQTEAISGSDHNDVIRGDDRGSNEEIEVELSLANHRLTQAGVERIDGLRDLLDLADYAPVAGVDPESVTAWTGGNLLIGGDGGDLIEGRGGDDFIHGDAWLNVRIRITGVGQANDGANEIATVDTLKHVFAAGELDSNNDPIPPAWHGKSLSELLLSREIRPNQLHIVREIKYDEDPSNDTDTAIFAGNRDWYEITHVGDKTLVARREMEEVDPQIDEGVDTLVGIERILFADGIYTIRQTGNHDPTGRLSIAGLPAEEGQPLTVSASAIRDLNNPDGTVQSDDITYRWQIERNDGTGDYINIPGASGDTFTPTGEHVGLRIRVLGSYTDGGGVLEVVTSQPTDPVENVDGDPAGDVLISDMTPTEGQPLTATAAFTDPDGITDAFEEGLLTYQWESSTNGTTWIGVPAENGGNARTFVPGPDLVGTHLRMRINYTDDGGNAEEVISAATQIVGNYISENDPIISETTGGDAQGGTTIGDDIVLGGPGSNDISGGAGDDTLLGSAGEDTLSGDDGNDVLNGGAGIDTVDGGAGNDIILYGNGEGSDVISGGEGSDTLRIVEGAFGADDEVTVALTGGVITSVNGSASISGVEAAELHLNGGLDTLAYQTGQNVSVNLLSGAATGFSFIRGVENVVAGGGNDTLLGNGAANTLNGGDGHDDVRGGFGNDALLGGAGNDQLYGEQGDDVLTGGAGNDRIDGGAGNDTASYASAGGAVTVSLAGTPVRASFEEQDTVNAGLDRLIGIENLVGSGFGDTLAGDANANIIDGGAGADAMDGGAGNDTYVVDNAGDTISDVSGVDTVQTALAGYLLDADVENLVLTGNAAIDGIGNTLDNEITGNSANNTLNGGGGTDTVVLGEAISDHAFALTPQSNITVTTAAGGTDTLVGIERAKMGTTSYLIVPGTNAANSGALAILGGNDAELLLGFNGADELRGNGGDDLLVGGAGADDMFGGAGNDIYWVQQGGDRVTELSGEGIDTIHSNVSRNLGNAAQVVGDVENVVLVGVTGVEALTAVGNALNNQLTGNAGDNTLNGGAGNDTLIGNAGDDSLAGGANDDILDGGAGADTLNGGGGIDTAVFAGSAGDYVFGLGSGGLATVTHLATGDVDTLSAIEKIRFGDGPVLDILTGVVGIPSGPAIIFGSSGNDTIVGGPGEDVIIGGTGDDTLNGSDVGDGDDNVSAGSIDDDTFIWSVGDGTDTINGGREGVGGDLFQIIGNEAVETYRIYTYDEAVARIGFAGSDEAEIIVTRQSEGGLEAIIAELTEIEEIAVNGAGVSGNGSSGGDTFEMYGDFAVATSLRPDTITLFGTNGDDTIDITSLRSAHRIVFKTGGGNDTIVGTLRPQDVIELPDGATIADYEVTIDEETGLTKLAGDGHSLTFVAPHGMPDFGADYLGDYRDDDDDTGNGDDEDEDDDDTGNDDDDNDNDDDDDCGCDEDDTGTPAPNPTGGAVRPGTSQSDVLVGTAGADALIGLGGDDVLTSEGGDDTITAGEGDDFADAGAGTDIVFLGGGDDHGFGGEGNDALYGEAGDDRVFGGAGNDRLEGGTGDDTLVGGAGDDLFIGARGDGNDTYHGADLGGGGGGGVDTLDLSAASTTVTVDLGNGLLSRGSAVGAQTGTDTLWGIENVATGSGDDVITASSAVNVVEGGAGDDVFRFRDQQAADGDTILDFEPGDRLDLSEIDANLGAGGNQAFSIVNGPAFTASGQLMVTYETREDGQYTILSGNTGGDLNADFQIDLKGTITLNPGNIAL